MALKRKNQNYKLHYKSRSRNLLSRSGKTNKNPSKFLQPLRRLRDHPRRNQFRNSVRSSQNHFRRHKRILEDLFNQEEMHPNKTALPIFESLEPTLTNRILQESPYRVLSISQQNVVYFTKLYANIQFYQNATSTEFFKKNVDPAYLIIFQRKLIVHSGIVPFGYTKGLKFGLT